MRRAATSSARRHPRALLAAASLIALVLVLAGSGRAQSFLDPTPDADSADPDIVAKAAELGSDAQQIFAFVRDEIGYESYPGSFRGARGTLWSGAGNALDRSNLLIALLRASGIPARYVRGPLSEELAGARPFDVPAAGAGPRLSRPARRDRRSGE